MLRKLKFKDDIPKYVWLGNRGVPRDCTVLQYTDGTEIYVSNAPSYGSALARIHDNSQYMVKQYDLDRMMFALVQYLDDEDEDVFYLMLAEFTEWHEMLDMDWYKSETE